MSAAHIRSLHIRTRSIVLIVSRIPRLIEFCSTEPVATVLNTPNTKCMEEFHTSCILFGNLSSPHLSLLCPQRQ